MRYIDVMRYINVMRYIYVCVEVLIAGNKNGLKILSSELKRLYLSSHLKICIN